MRVARTRTDSTAPAQSDKVIVFERGNLLFVFNMHPSKSYTDYRVGTDWGGEYHVVLSSDDKEFGGHARIDKSVHHFTTNLEWNGRKNFLQVRCSLAFDPFLALHILMMILSQSCTRQTGVCRSSRTDPPPDNAHDGRPSRQDSPSHSLKFRIPFVVPSTPQKRIPYKAVTELSPRKRVAVCLRAGSYSKQQLPHVWLKAHGPGSYS